MSLLIDIDVLYDLAQELRGAAQTNDTAAGDWAFDDVARARFRTQADTFRESARRIERTERKRRAGASSRLAKGMPDKPYTDYCRLCGHRYVVAWWHRLSRGHWPTDDLWVMHR